MRQISLTHRFELMPSFTRVLSNLLKQRFEIHPNWWTDLYSEAGTSRVIFKVITDNGCGIPPEFGNIFFERHYRGVQRSSKIPGTGLD